MRDLTFSVSYQPHMLQDLVPTYSCYCRGGPRLMRAVTQQLLHLISHLQLVGEVSSNWRGDFRLEILILTQKGMKLVHSRSKWKQEPITCSARQNSSSWRGLMQLYSCQHTPGQCLWLNHPRSLLLCGTSSSEAQSMCVTFYFAWDKIPMACILGITLLQCLLQVPLGQYPIQLFHSVCHSLMKIRAGGGGGNRRATLETVSEIPHHLMKAFLFFGLHPSMLISFECWNKWVCLVLIVNRSWAELDTGPKGMGTEMQGPSDWENTKCSFRIATAWQRKPKYDPTSFFRKLCHRVPLYYQNTCIWPQ